MHGRFTTGLILVYSLVISSAIFPIYYAALFADTNTIYFAGYAIKNTAMISFVTAAAFFGGGIHFTYPLGYSRFCETRKPS